VVVMNGGTSYLASAKESIEALQKEVAVLTEAHPIHVKQPTW
jgi:hypothetical protein